MFLSSPGSMASRGFMRLLLLTLLLVPGLASAGRSEPPRLYTGIGLVRCLDGDTCIFDIPVMDAFFGRYVLRERMVRLAGLDAPEIEDAQCAFEYNLGVQAMVKLVALLQAAKRIDLLALGDGGWRGVLATVLADGVDVAQILKAEGLGRPWKGMREEWC